MIEFLDSTVDLDICQNDQLFWILKLVRIVIRIVCLAAPFALVLFGSLDFFKAIIAGDEKQMKEKRKPFIGRLVAAIIILLLPTIVNMVVSTFSPSGTFKSCWSATNQGNKWKVSVPTIDD